MDSYQSDKLTENLGRSKSMHHVFFVCDVSLLFFSIVKICTSKYDTMIEMSEQSRSQFYVHTYYIVLLPLPLLLRCVVMVRPWKAGNHPPQKAIGPFSCCLDGVLYSG